MFKKFLLLVFSLFLVTFLACSKDSTGPNDDTDNSDIPADPTTISVPAPVINNVLPAAPDFIKTANNPSRIKANLLGLLNPNTEQPITLSADYEGTGYNFYLEEDDILKGVKLTKVGSGTTLAADVVFVVDNSGSMDDEADSVANSIIEFADFLANSGLNVNFACVGYQYGEVNGGINFTTKTKLQKYLTDRPYIYYGTDRTIGFSGADSAELENAAYYYAYPDLSSENGVMGIFFADSLYHWRAGAQRVFINFTDESTQPNNSYRWSTEYLCNNLSNATVHTVFSSDTTTYHGEGNSGSYEWTDLWDERPWAMSECTGGTIKFISSDASGLNLADLPVAGALSNSYLVEFVTASPNGVHTIKITIKDTGIDGQRIIENITY